MDILDVFSIILVWDCLKIHFFPLRFRLGFSRHSISGVDAVRIFFFRFMDRMEIGIGNFIL